MTNIFFVTGTDTDSGKTSVMSALMKKTRLLGHTVIGYKPVVSGFIESHGVLINSDLESIRNNSTYELTIEQCSSYRFIPAIAPHIAALREGISIDTKIFDQSIKSLTEEFNPDYMYIEGAGGWHLPLSDGLLMSSWVAEKRIPVILNVGARLGCLNHALLSREAIERSGCELAGYIINHVDPKMECYSENMEWLKKSFSDIPLIGEIPYIENFSSEQLAQFICDNLCQIR